MGGGIARRPRAYITSGELRCPKCGKVLAKAYYGAYAGGIEIKCGKCHTFVLVDVNRLKENTRRQETI